MFFKYETRRDSLILNISSGGSKVRVLAQFLVNILSCSPQNMVHRYPVSGSLAKSAMAYVKARHASPYERKNTCLSREPLRSRELRAYLRTVIFLTALRSPPRML